MGSTKIKNERRDYAAEYKKNLETQLEYADRVYESEAKYQPMYAGLQASIMEQYAPRLMELYEGQINPALSRMDLEATRSKRLADVEALEKYGARATAAIEAADPQTAALRRELNAQALSELELGGQLTGAQKRNLRQSVAAGQSQRGFGRGVSDQAMSSLAELDLMEQRRRSRQQFAQGQMGMSAALGADPASCSSASAPLPYCIDEFLMAGFIRKKSVPLVKCKTVDLEVPANAEIILEGYIDPSEMRLEGPFGDHTGYYSQDGDYPVLHLTAITHRKDPIYLTTIVGKPPQEDFYLGRATERIFLPLLKTQLPEIADMNMPAEGVFHNCVIVSIDKRYPMQSRRIMSALWGLGQMSFVKIIITVDSKVNVHDYEEVTKILLSTVDFETDLFFSEGILDVLNHASDQVLYGSKLGIDLTSKIEGEPGYGKKVTARTELKTLPTPEMVTETFQELTACQIIELEVPILLVALDKQTINQGAKFIDAFLDHQDFSAIEIVIVLERHVNLSNISIVMWKLFNNLDPKRDFYFKNNRLGIDVTKKLLEEGYQQHWPEEIEMSSAVKTKVNKKWDTLFKE